MDHQQPSSSFSRRDALKMMGVATSMEIMQLSILNN